MKSIKSRIMKSIKSRIKTVMKSKKGESPIIECILFAVSIIYLFIIKLRLFCFKKRIFKTKKISVPVISIGNLTVGGTGKTPMTIYIAKMLKSLGYKTVVISRGYKGRAGKKGGIVSNGEKVLMQGVDAGDEPYLIAKTLESIPVLVGKNRFKSGIKAINKFAPDAIVLDDAFQHLKISRDVDLLLIDFSMPFGNYYMLPRGVLREPLSSIKRGSAIVLTRCKTESSGYQSCSKSLFYEKPVFRTSHVPYIKRVIKSELLESIKEHDTIINNKLLKGAKVFLFSGLGNNDDFWETVKSFGCNIAGFKHFSDHHAYSRNDCIDIYKMAKVSEANFIVTTEKDFVKIDTDFKWSLDFVIVGIRVNFVEGENDFINFIKDVVF